MSCFLPPVVVSLLAVFPALLLAASAPSQTAVPSGPSPDTRAEIRTLLELWGLDRSLWENLPPGTDAASGGEELLVKLLDRMRRFQPGELARWTRSSRGPSWPSLLEKQDNPFGTPVRLSGRLRELRWQEITPELARLVGMDRFALVSVDLQETAALQGLVCVSRLPRTWVRGDPKGQPVRCDGVVVQVLPRSGSPPVVLVATPHLEWYPEQASPELGITEDQALLARHGVDVAALLELRPRAPLETADRESFYQVLSAVRQIPPPETTLPGLTGVLPHLLTGGDLWPQRGRRLRLAGLARRITRIPVAAADIHDRYGITHYYQVDVFVPLERPVQLVEPGTGKPTGVVYETMYPVTVCVTEVPDEVWNEDRTGEFIHLDVDFPVVFFKMWSHPVPFVTEQHPGGRQVVPLLIGARLVAAPPVQPSAFWYTALALAFVAGGLLVVFGLWRASRGDRRFRQRWQQRHAPPSFPSSEEP